MKTYCCFTLLLFTIILAGFSPAALAAGQEFTIINVSSADIYDLSITPSGHAVRGPNALKAQDLLHGQRVRLIFSNYDPAIAQWDVVGITCCGETLQWRQLNLQTAHTITLHAGGLAELN
ncbi:MAG TPA: hypothetical protein DEA44_11800 [Firmicutes bacterium]|nr:hypothetical protein [Bacillota bacterium]